MSDAKAESRKSLCQKRATEILGSRPLGFENPLTVLASPAWRGIEGDIWRASSDERSVILKHYHSDTDFYVTPGLAIEAARQAGELGIGPAVLGSWESDGLVAMEDLGAQWRAGGLHDAVSPSIRSSVVGLKKAFQGGATLKITTSIFDEIERLCNVVESSGLPTHRDKAIFLNFFREARAKIISLGFDVLRCHRDGNTANIMVGPNNSVKLVDYDISANADPFEDLGCHLVEYFESDADARSGFEEWHGSFDEGLFQRSMLYGLADDMRWGLIAAIMAATSERRSLEFAKYSAWRFIRLERRAKSSNANDRIRIAA